MRAVQDPLRCLVRASVCVCLQAHEGKAGPSKRQRVSTEPLPRSQVPQPAIVYGYNPVTKEVVTVVLDTEEDDARQVCGTLRVCTQDWYRTDRLSCSFQCVLLHPAGDAKNRTHMCPVCAQMYKQSYDAGDLCFAGAARKSAFIRSFCTKSGARASYEPCQRQPGTQPSYCRVLIWDHALVRLLVAYALCPRLLKAHKCMV